MKKKDDSCSTVKKAWIVWLEDGDLDRNAIYHPSGCSLGWVCSCLVVAMLGTCTD
jgi:hypothetical protein